MDKRLRRNPAFFEIEALAGVGTYDHENWFVCTLQANNPKTGKVYPGYMAFWGFKTIYPSKELAAQACKKWLGTKI